MKIYIYLFIRQLSVQRDLLRFAQVFSQMLHVAVPLRLNNVSFEAPILNHSPQMNI